jgi:hypothetical protein
MSGIAGKYHQNVSAGPGRTRVQKWVRSTMGENKNIKFLAETLPKLRFL